jgi:hypothetical protein
MWQHYPQDQSEHCQFYKDKSLIVELPVKVGQMVYRIASYGNSRNQIISTEIEENQVVSVYYQEEIETQYRNTRITVKEFETTYAEGYTEADIGKIVFLTKEEAEAKLKEINND